MKLLYYKTILSNARLYITKARFAAKDSMIDADYDMLKEIENLLTNRITEIEEILEKG